MNAGPAVSDATAHVCINAVRCCVVGAARLSGMSPPAAAALIGFTPEQLADPSARAPAALVYDAWQILAGHLGDDAFGLHVAEAVYAFMFDAYDFAVTSAPTIRSGIESMARLLRLQHDGAELRLSVDGDMATVSVLFLDSRHPPRHYCEFAVAVWLLRARQLALRPFEPSLIRFRHATPTNVDAHRRVFGAPLAFSETEDCVVFDAVHLDTPLRTKNSALQKVMEQVVSDRIESLPSRNDLVGTLRLEVRARLAEGLPELDTVARALGRSPRSLQRSLAQAGWSYQRVVDDLRRELAASWIQDRTLTLGEIGGRLGFAEQASFNRAFVRWMGQSPSSYRAALSRETVA
jgi:AraC-like DNA-binding protein